jgi:hypothetical protein
MVVRRRSVFLLLLAPLVGCATESHTDRTEELVRLFETGRYEAAVEVAAELAEESDNHRNLSRRRVPRDGLIIRLEQGAALRAAGDLRASDAVFQRADEILEIVATTPLVKLDEETASLWTNPTALAYRGTATDAVMIAVLQAMNHLELGDVELARVYLRRADERVDEAAERYEREIREDQREAQRAIEARGGELNASTIARLRREAGAEPDDAATRYGDFGNPLANYLDAAVFLAGRPSRGDLERARLSAERAVELEPRNDSARRLLDIAERSVTVGEVAGGPYVHVIYGAGMAPTLRESRVELPFVLLGGGLDRLGVPTIALPFLVYGPSTGPVMVALQGERLPAQEIVAVDGLVRAEFDAGYSRRVARAVAGMTVKTLAAAAINTAVDHSVRREDESIQALAFILSRVVTSVAQTVSTAADLRTWRLLPERFDVLVFDRPDNGTFTLDVAGRSFEVFVEPDGTSFVFVRLPSSIGDPVVRVAHVPDDPRRIASP